MLTTAQIRSVALENLVMPQHVIAMTLTLGGSMQNYHVKPHDGHWDITKEGAQARPQAFGFRIAGSLRRPEV